MALVELRNVTKRYHKGDETITPLDGVSLDGIDWVIVGGESGPRARPIREEWVCAIRNGCREHRVPFFFKQWGAFNCDGKRVGKGRAGRELAGRTWDGMPSIRTREVVASAR